MSKQSRTIKRALKARSMSQAAFSRRVGISESHTSKVVNGTRRLGIGKVLGIARALGIPVEELLP
jgi:transcriptional regulator with XRE-family HTH domain